MSLFERYVQVGRVVMVNKGEYQGKLAVIVEIIDHGRLLVDGTGIKRGVMSLKQVTLTSIKVDIPRGIKTKSLLKKLDKQGLQQKWQQTAWAKKIAKNEARKALGDFDRFKVMLARKKQSTVVGKKYATMLKK